jgi:hypothetical protein
MVELVGPPLAAESKERRARARSRERRDGRRPVVRVPRREQPAAPPSDGELARRRRVGDARVSEVARPRQGVDQGMGAAERLREIFRRGILIGRSVTTAGAVPLDLET